VRQNSPMLTRIRIRVDIDIGLDLNLHVHFASTLSYRAHRPHRNVSSVI
jgi:hypothetical protein